MNRLANEVENERVHAGPDPSQWTKAIVNVNITAQRKDGHHDVISATTTIGMHDKAFDQTNSHRPEYRRFHAEGELMAKYPVVLTPDETGGYVVECPSLPGCISEGDSIDEAISNIKEAIEGYLETCKARNIELPDLQVRFVEV